MTQSENSGIGMYAGWVITLFLVILFVVLFFSNNMPRTGYFYIQGEGGKYVVRMDSSDSSSTTITRQLSFKEAIALADKLNEDISGKQNF